MHFLPRLHERDAPRLPQLRGGTGSQAPAETTAGAQIRTGGRVSGPSDFIVAIPARYGSTRLPGKPLRLLGGEPLIVHVVRRARAAGAARVVVATDDDRIARAVADSGIDVCMTRSDHASGSDRLAECADREGWRDDALVVNLQGDEPFAPVAGIRAVAETLCEDDAPMATLAAPITSTGRWFDPNCVKLVRDLRGRALYFSRAPLPWARDALARDRQAMPDGVAVLRHIGIYGYRAGFLKTFAALPPSPLERAEALEQLRALEHGYPIAVRITPEPFPPGIDTPEDLVRAERVLAEQANAR
jgi:3-deoxy-manno-octulosonate cytidylyltransferase (CMP-KDO synthetase)